MDRSTATAAARSSPDSVIRIEHRCPQCGAPVLLGESDTLLRCRFCRVSLHLCANDAPRRLYLPPRSSAPGEEILFVPYWRIKGIHYAGARDGRLAHAFLDKTQLAVAIPGLAPSLGVRPQAVPLHFVTEETPGTFLEPTLPLDRVLARVDEDLREPDEEPAAWTALVGETMSLVHLPVRRNRGIFDAVSGRKVTDADPWPDGAAGPRTASPPPPLRFVPTLCPSCGWELDHAPASLLLPCTTCGSVWEESGGRFARRAFRVGVSASGDARPARREAVWHLPFWRFPLDDGSRPQALWVPAFKLHAEQALRLARTFTTAQEATRESPLPRDGRVHPITLPPGEGMDAARVLAHAQGWHAQAGALRADPGLAFLPFAEEGAELVRSRPRCAVAKNLLSFGLGL